jgi:hypothetical protein
MKIHFSTILGIGLGAPMKSDKKLCWKPNCIWRENHSWRKNPGEILLQQKTMRRRTEQTKEHRGFYIINSEKNRYFLYNRSISAYVYTNLWQTNMHTVQTLTIYMHKYINTSKSTAHRVHTECQRPLSGEHSIMMEKLEAGQRRL